MNALHVYPVEDAIEHDTETDACICGPALEHVATGNGDGWVYVHHSLDGREQYERR
ncbi:hypothetical protein ICM05_09805 [Leucobacter sp. cx-42]|uniref:hypothetical protein n=1 Tax=unclassified Leucobacter TaxID=2621730 RepID=UPI00165DC71E|nr:MULTISPECIES: hypothetical protein [unclassified Leucobacter]MBC9954931.1 hypothetical protein [Leucobacter sp. cx-42]